MQMRFRWTDVASRSNAGLAISLGLAISSCAFTPYEARHEVLSDSRSQIWLSEARQVKIRAAQSRVFEDADRARILEAIVTAMQDLGFQIDVLDEVLGIVSGKKFEELESVPIGVDPNYFLYNDESLLIFTKTYRTWGPFYYRDNLVRLTVTVRPRSETQLVVRSSAQFYMRAVENPKPYQKFFRTLEQAIFAQRELDR
jgi:hypothetical protein